MHSLWLHFLQSVCFDHSILLDLLLLPETEFGAVLQDYINLVLTDWKGFQQICENRNYSKSFAVCHSKSTETSAYALQPLEGRLRLRNELISPPLKKPRFEDNLKGEGSKTAILVDYSSSDEEQSDIGKSCSEPGLSAGDSSSEEELAEGEKVSHDTVEHSLFPPDSQCSYHTRGTSPDPVSTESSLDKVMGCFIHLHFALDRLETNELLPPHVVISGLTTAMESLEELYEEN